jgi:hypothetical protein
LVNAFDLPKQHSLGSLNQTFIYSSVRMSSQ